jgi:hypothetical protein
MVAASHCAGQTFRVGEYPTSPGYAQALACERLVTPVSNNPGIWSGGEAQSARGVHPAAHPPRLSTAAAHPAPEPRGEAPPPIAARSRSTESSPPVQPTWLTCSLADPLSHPQGRYGAVPPDGAGSGGNGEAGAPGVFHDSPPEPLLLTRIRKAQLTTYDQNYCGGLVFDDLLPQRSIAVLQSVDNPIPTATVRSGDCWGR